MKATELHRIRVGDRIKFSTLTRWGRRTATRVVTQVPDLESLSSLRHRFGVTFEGCRPFYLRDGEILEHFPAPGRAEREEDLQVRIIEARRKGDAQLLERLKRELEEVRS